jgi:N4-gp56 family major capsid protein
MPTARYDINFTTLAQVAEWTPEVWSRLVYEVAQGKMLWSNFIGGEGSGQPVVLKTELLTKKGDTIHISQLANLSGDGKTDEETLEGYEEQLDLREMTTSPTWYKHAVADTSMVEKVIDQDFRSKAQMLLSKWMTEKMDNSLWTAATAGVAAGLESVIPNIIYGGSGNTSENELGASDTFNVSTVEKGVVYLESQNIDPLVIGGQAYYVCLLHPYQAYNLRQDSDWITAHTTAKERGIDNPIFTLSLGAYHGVLFYQTTQCPTATNNGGSGIQIGRSILMGADAFCRGMGENIRWEEQVGDYNTKRGIGIFAAWEDKVLSAYAFTQLKTAAVNPNA